VHDNKLESHRLFLLGEQESHRLNDSIEPCIAIPSDKDLLAPAIAVKTRKQSHHTPNYGGRAVHTPRLSGRKPDWPEESCELGAVIAESLNGRLPRRTSGPPRSLPPHRRPAPPPRSSAAGAFAGGTGTWAWASDSAHFGMAHVESPSQFHDKTIRAPLFF